MAALLVHYNKKSYLQIKNYAAFTHALVGKSRVRSIIAIKHRRPVHDPEQDTGGEAAPGGRLVRAVRTTDLIIAPPCLLRCAGLVV
jgi:hypothetical protein